MNEHSKLTNELKQIKDMKEKYGDYHKTLLHFHTPASHDYKYILKKNKDGENETKSYAAIEEEELIEIAKGRNLFRDDIFMIDELREMVIKNTLFLNLTELLAYLLIADTLLLKKIEVAVITDHNTIQGYEKLKDALNIIKSKHRKRNNKIAIPKLLLGIEISCGDSVHVVGIINSKDEIIQFLKAKIVSKNLGSFLPSWEVIELFKSYGSIAYIAHINTANIDGKGMSGAYKEKIFSAKNMQAIGISDLSKESLWRNKLKNNKRIPEVTILYDEDSHNLNDLGEKTFYVKGQTLDFNMFQNAIEDSDVAIKYTTPKLPNIFVKSISIDGKGFLSEEGSHFNASFSTALNCIIGGRGSGKSTLLDCISFVLSQSVESVAQLKNICKQGRIVLCISVNSEDYYIMFNPAVEKVLDENFVRGYMYGEEHQFEYHESVEKRIDNNSLKEITRKKIQIFTIDGEKIYEIQNKNKFFNSIFRASYSINQLVKRSSDNQIQKFIIQQLSASSNKIPKYKNRNIKSDYMLEYEYSRFSRNLVDHKEQIKKLLSPINKEVKNIRIAYKQQSINSLYFDWIENIDSDLFATGRDWFQRYNVDINALLSFFEYSISKFGVIELYLKFAKKDWDILKSILIKNAVIVGPNDLENGIRQINEANVTNVLGELWDKIIRPQKRKIYKLIDEFYQESDQFDLEFDINSYDKNSKSSIFKSISEISLGQKVVGLLDFIFLFGQFTNDETPLLLDQPEDNLDSRYVYNHLVSALRRQKDNRQVLIVTHNSTIVTNSKPEQVITMKSDNLHGWVEGSGYPTESEVILNIITTLEGGIESFKHKQFIYKHVIDTDKM